MGNKKAGVQWPAIESRSPPSVVQCAFQCAFQCGKSNVICGRPSASAVANECIRGQTEREAAASGQARRQPGEVREAGGTRGQEGPVSEEERSLKTGWKAGVVIVTLAKNSDSRSTSEIERDWQKRRASVGAGSTSAKDR